MSQNTESRFELEVDGHHFNLRGPALLLAILVGIPS